MNIGGYRVTIKRLRNGRAQTEVFGAKFAITRAVSAQSNVIRQQAEKKSGFLEVLRIETLSVEQFEKEFPAGCGKKGRFVSLRA